MFARKRLCSAQDPAEYGKRRFEEEEGSEEDAEQAYYQMNREWTDGYLEAPENTQLALAHHRVPYDEELERRMAVPWRTDPMASLAVPFRSIPTIDPREVYCTVPGRTSLLSSTTKYRVTVGEIQRRISPPECLNASLLGGILRKAKSKDGGKALRDSLRRLGIALPAGRRKQTSVTCWTALVEEEAVHMARDFAHACEKEFHAREFAVHLSKGFVSTPDPSPRRLALHNARQILDELLCMLSCDRSPLTSLARPEVAHRPMDVHLQQHLAHFTLVTHGFGVLAMHAVVSSLIAVVDETIRALDRTPYPFNLKNERII